MPLGADYEWIGKCQADSRSMNRPTFKLCPVAVYDKFANRFDVKKANSALFGMAVELLEAGKLFGKQELIVKHGLPCSEDLSKLDVSLYKKQAQKARIQRVIDFDFEHVTSFGKLALLFRPSFFITFFFLFFGWLSMETNFRCGLCCLCFMLIMVSFCATAVIAMTSRKSRLMLKTFHTAYRS